MKFGYGCYKTKNTNDRQEIRYNSQTREYMLLVIIFPYVSLCCGMYDTVNQKILASVISLPELLFQDFGIFLFSSHWIMVSANEVNYNKIKYSQKLKLWVLLLY